MRKENDNRPVGEFESGNWIHFHITSQQVITAVCSTLESLEKGQRERGQREEGTETHQTEEEERKESEEEEG
jgi:hypothetical protein